MTNGTDTKEAHADTIRFTITFEHIGRSEPGPLAFEMRETDVTAEIVAQRVFNYATKYLASRAFEVVVDLEKGIGAIDYGRFGAFTVTWIKPVSLYAIDPDFRKEPKTSVFCIVCQRDLKSTDRAIRVHAETSRDNVLLTDDPNGEALIGAECRRKYKAAQQSTNPALVKSRARRRSPRK